MESKKKSFIYIILLILAGESIFILPFVIPRIFRPTYLEVFNISNLELGTCQSIYGLVAFFSYIFGGPFADKYQPKYLMAISLFLTVLGGIYLFTYPSLTGLMIVYGFWGLTTIFLFWSAMIKATRIWGGQNNQGIAFGFLDGGRGLVSATFGSLGILIFSNFINIDIEASSIIEKQEAFKKVILAASGLVIIVGVFVIFLLNSKTYATDQTTVDLGLKSFISIAKMPSVLLLMIIVMCAYVGYKMTDVFSLYANEILNYNDIESAKIGSFLLYLRPIVGISIGFLADKTRASLWLVIGFALTIISSLLFISGLISSDVIIVFYFSVVLMALGVYSARILYFAAMEEGKIPLAITGTVVGFISLIGFTPDIFAGPMMGYLLDNPNKILAHQHTFIALGLFSVVGLLASIWFYKLNSSRLFVFNRK